MDELTLRLGWLFVILAILFGLGVVPVLARRFYLDRPRLGVRLAAPVLFAGVAGACFQGAGLPVLTLTALLGAALIHRWRSATRWGFPSLPDWLRAGPQFRCHSVSLEDAAPPGSPQPQGGCSCVHLLVVLGQLVGAVAGGILGVRQGPGPGWLYGMAGAALGFVAGTLLVVLGIGLVGLTLASVLWIQERWLGKPPSGVFEPGGGSDPPRETPR